jgi:ribosomal protein S18 acetylase RimI-like enzyme
MTELASVTIRLAQPADRKQWEPLFLAYGVFYKTDFTPEILDGVWAWIMDDNHPLSAFVADSGGTLVGFAHVREQPDTFVAGPSWFLDDLFTNPDVRGQGIGRALIDAVSAHAAHHGGGDLRWITAADNDQAQHLYDTLATKTSWVMYEKSISEETA